MPIYNRTAALHISGGFEQEAYTAIIYKTDFPLDLKEMLRRTEDFMSRGVENICSNSYSDPLMDKALMHYAWDIAYQKYVLTRSMDGSFSR